MARGAPRALLGFETGSLYSEVYDFNGTNDGAPCTNTHFAGSVSIEGPDTSNVRSGHYSLKVNPASGAAGWWGWIPTPTSAPTVQTIGPGAWSQFYVKITSLPGTARKMLCSNNTGGGYFYHQLRLNTDGTISHMAEDGTTVIGTTTTALTDTSKWYKLTLHGAYVGGLWRLALRIDGTEETYYQASGGGNYGWGGRFGTSDTVAATYTMYIDDITLYNGNVDTTDEPGDSHIVYMPVVADNTIGATWYKADHSTQTGLYECLNNVPPVGVASANETSNPNASIYGGPTASNSTFDTATFDSVFSSSDVLLSAQHICIHGEDVATGSKMHSSWATNNPSNGVYSGTYFGGDSGAHGAFAGGLWWVTHSYMTGGNYPQAMNLTTSPPTRSSPCTIGVRALQASRYGCVCLLGLMVEYRPSPAGARPYLRRTLQAVSRSTL